MIGKLKIRILVISTLAVVGLVYWGATKFTKQSEVVPVKVEATDLNIPTFIPTKGGRLEISTVSVRQAFKLDDDKKTFAGLNLGKTTSEVKVDVVYRYYIPMAKRWPIDVRPEQKRVKIIVNEVLPTLPVSFDTKTMEKQTSSGWARFDKDQNLQALETKISAKLEELSRHYVKQASNEGRSVVKEFVRTWLLANSNIGGDYEVEVVFPTDK